MARKKITKSIKKEDKKVAKKEARKEAKTVVEQALRHVMSDDWASTAAQTLGGAIEFGVGSIPEAGDAINAANKWLHIWSKRASDGSLTNARALSVNPFHPSAAKTFANKPAMLMDAKPTIRNGVQVHPGGRRTLYRQGGCAVQLAKGSVGGGVPIAKETDIPAFHEEHEMGDGLVVLTGREYLFPASAAANAGDFEMSSAFDPSDPVIGSTRIGDLLKKYDRYKTVALTLCFASSAPSTVYGSMMAYSFSDPDTTLKEAGDPVSRIKAAYTLDESMSMVQLWNSLARPLVINGDLLYVAQQPMPDTAPDERFNAPCRFEVLVQNQFDNSVDGSVGNWFLEYDICALEPVPTPTQLLNNAEASAQINATDLIIYDATGRVTTLATLGAGGLPQVNINDDYLGVVFDPIYSGMTNSVVPATQVDNGWAQLGSLANLGVKSVGSNNQQWNFRFPQGSWEFKVILASAAADPGVVTATAGSGTTNLVTVSGNFGFSTGQWRSSTFTFDVIGPGGTLTIVRGGGSGASFVSTCFISLQAFRTHLAGSLQKFDAYFLSKGEVQVSPDVEARPNSKRGTLMDLHARGLLTEAQYRAALQEFSVM